MKHLIFAALLLTSCASSDVMRVGDHRAPTRPEDVQVLLEEPTRPHSTVAIVEASDQGWGMGLEKLKRLLVKKAAEAGGQAVILGESTTQAAGGGYAFVPMGAAGAMAVPVDVKKLTGKVIVFD